MSLAIRLSRLAPPPPHSPILSSAPLSPPPPLSFPPPRSFVAEETEGFIDLDAVPSDGASTAEITRFILGPEGASLRPWLVGEIVQGLDLFLRDRGHKAFDALEAALTPRLPFLGALPAPPMLPVLVPGLGLVPPRELAEKLLPSLTVEEQVYLEAVVGVAATVLGVEPEVLGDVSPDAAVRSLLNPSEQGREVAAVLSGLASGEEGTEAAMDIAEQVRGCASFGCVP